jgi:hypothetical protein
MNPSNTETPENSSPQAAAPIGFVGNPSLSNVSHFVDNAEALQPIDFINWLIRISRGNLTRIILNALAVGLVMAILLFFKVSPRYESHAVIRVATTQPYILYEGNSMASRTFDAFVQAQVGMLSGTILLETSVNALKTLDADFDLSPAQFQSHLRIKEDKSVIRIIAESNSALTSEQYANTILDSYLEAQRAQVRNRGSYRERELAQREINLTQRLDAKLEEMLDLGGEYGIDSAILAHQSKIELLQNSTALLEGFRWSIAELEAYGESGGSRIADDEALKELVDDDALDSMLFDHSLKQSELARLQLRYQPASRKVREAKIAILVLEDAMSARRNQIKTLKMSGEMPTDGASIEIKISETEEKIARFQPQHKRLEEEARELNVKIVRLKSLDKESSVLRELLDETKRTLDRVRLENRFDVPGVVEVVSRAQFPLESSKDNRFLFSLAGLILGFGAVLSAYVARSIVQPVVRFSDDLSAMRNAPAVAGFLKSREDEQPQLASDLGVFRLRNNIQLSDIAPLYESRRARVIAVMGDTKLVQTDYIGMHLGEAFATSGMNTLFIQADLNAKNTDNNDTQNQGWREYLANAELTVESGRSGLWVMEVGQEQAMLDLQVSFAKVREAIAQLSNSYDVIILDLGAFSQSMASEFVLTQCDLSLLATRPGTSTGNLKRTLHEVAGLSPERVRMVMSEMLENDPKYLRA